MCSGDVHSGGAGEVKPTGSEHIDLDIDGAVDRVIVIEGQ